MNVQEKIKKVENKRGRNHELSIFREWLDTYLPDHVHLKKIQVAGTNGKGSTSTWISTFLQQAGYRVGVFTSPHLITHEERIRINDTLIHESDWERIYDQYEPVFETNQFTMFEIDTFMAIAYFLEQKVDFCVMEVGLGGRKDATTALDYLVTIITNIGLDHQEYLGNTFKEVAYEKAGVFQVNGISLTTETKKECLEVFQEEAKKKQCTLTVIQDTSLLNEFHFPHVEYQKKNCVLALKTIESLHISLSKNQIQEGIHSFVWAGRFMILQNHPKIIVDGAHNVHGIQALVQSLQTFQGHIYFSALQEKDAVQMISMLETLQCPITLVEFDSYRLYPLEKLGYPIISMKELENKIKTTQTDLLLCGSLYFVGDVLKLECFNN